MNIKEIKEMINLMNENSLMEMEIEKDGMRIRLKKSSPAGENMQSQILIEKERIVQPAAKAVSEITEKENPNSIEIKAPMVGTFYRAPSPEAPPYVEVGQVIEPGQVICIIEAMKLMNEIKSEIKGKIIEILADNAEPVEFGQPMFLIEAV
ncbi:MAG: acetyl-CoA carboxylase biotin carboxyl carrier protein [Candidatus Omnitrophota bacterium]|jgi:oxaloacetate decarboxylase alpha subunit|nr:MAG: acetyl-CoA carboxylase biotin carboxyl carrier protein [Candidatus Omnitrophota bacterium]